MGSQHAIRFGIDDQLRHGALLTAANRMFERPEGGLENGHLMSCSHCLLFGEPHRADGRLAENSGWDGVIIHGLGLTTKLGLRKGHRFANGHRRELPAACHVA